MENTSDSEKSLPKNAQLSRSQRISCQTRSQTVSRLSQAEEDSKEIINDFKKVGHLNITVLCSMCQQRVHIRQLFHHKKTHQAQAVLDYQHPWAETIDINKIALRRQQLISNMIKTSTYTERAREKIGYSLEFLKESLKIAPYFCIDSIVQSSVHIKEVSSPLIKAIAICQDKNTLWHTELQDLFVVLDNYGNRPGTCFLGLFDGSNGVSAAETTSAELPLLFLEQLSSGDPSYQVSEAERRVLDSFRTVFRADYKLRERVFTVWNTTLKDKHQTSPPNNYEWIHRAYAKSFWRMDRLLRLGRNEVSRVCWSSCTAATCLVETTSNAKQQQQDQAVEEPLGRRKNEREQIITQHEKQQPERIMMSGKKQSNTEEQGVAPLLSNQKTEGFKVQEEEEKVLQKINEKNTGVSEQEDKAVRPSNKDSTMKKDLLEDNHSTAEPDESSFGVMHIANIGNVHAMLCKNGKSYWLTKEHTTYCKEEKSRVLEKGGYISSNEPKGLIEGLVRITRGLGHHGNPTLKKTVIPVPHTTSIPIDSSCQFLILASNGLWEVLDKSEVAALTLIMFSAYLKKYEQVQQEKKCRTPKGSKSTVDDFKEDIISWYFSHELFFADNQNQNNANLRPPANNSEGGERGQSGSFSENSEYEELEEIAEVTESSEYTTSSTTTESGSEEGSKESQIRNKSIEEQVPESSSESFSQISEDEANPKTFYNHAAKYISKHLVKAALKAGSRDNITVLVALLNGCDKIPTYI